MSTLKKTKTMLVKSVDTLKKSINSIPDEKIEQFEKDVKENAKKFAEVAKEGIDSIANTLSGLIDKFNEKNKNTEKKPKK